MINLPGLLRCPAAMFAMDLFLPKHLLNAGLAVALSLLFRIDLSAQPSALAVVNAGVQVADNEALAPHDYEFLPGDPLYVVFEIAGFSKKTDEEKDTRSIALTWNVKVQDGDGTLLAPPQGGEIKTGLSPEDKKWLPKRRAEFTLPRFVSAGEYRVEIAVDDALNNTHVMKELTFLIGGLKLEPTRSVAIEHVRFSRQDGGPQLQLPAYRPGDSVYLSFDIIGFALRDSHEYRVSYRFDVLRPDGKIYVKQPEPVELNDKTFYPAKFAPVNFSIETLADSPRGDYTVVLNVTDEVSGQTAVLKKTFTLE